MERSLEDLEKQRIEIENHLATLRELYVLINMAGVSYAGREEDRQSFEARKRFHVERVTNEIGNLYMARELTQIDMEGKKEAQSCDDIARKATNE